MLGAFKLLGNWCEVVGHPCLELIDQAVKATDIALQGCHHLKRPVCLLSLCGTFYRSHWKLIVVASIRVSLVNLASIDHLIFFINEDAVIVWVFSRVQEGSAVNSG